MQKWLMGLDAWGWRYAGNPRNMQGCHFTAKPAACDAILRCLDTLEAEGNGAHRTIPLKPLSEEDEVVIGGLRRYRCFEKLRIQIFAPSPDLEQMWIKGDGPVLHCEFTTRCLHEFREGVQNVKRGVGDYSIQPYQDKRRTLPMGERDEQSECLWFWPCFGHIRVER